MLNVGDDVDVDEDIFDGDHHIIIVMLILN